ncbi:MAG: F0F1 ATP synthase subunit B [candidate division Zixibacteria bacterium]|nr:F0F1 ATP synthase subunit B [candidate division Zixibacteria bacterium]
MGEIASSLGLELGQLVTHALGFLLAVWILKKFAWGPLLNLLDERKQKIQGEFDDIERQKEEMTRLTEEYQKKLDDIDAEARKRLQEAVSEGQKIAAEIKDQAKNEQKEIVAKAKQQIDAEIAAARTQLRNDMVNMAIQAASKAIEEKMDDEKQRKLISDFIEDLEGVK